MYRFLSRKMAVRAALAFGMMACGDSTTEPAGENEVISRVTLRLTPPGGGAALSAYIEDADGNGPGAPSAQVGTLALTKGVTYTGSVLFENRLVNPIANITTEVLAEASQHRVFYTVTATGVTVNTTDVDAQNRALGLAFTQAVSATATSGAGTVRVQLCHYPNAKVAGESTCSGETDILVTFGIAVN